MGATHTKMKFFIENCNPLPKPRMTGKDFWKKSAKAYWSYLDILVLNIKKARQKTTTKECELRVWFYRQGNKRADIDNLCKSILEAVERAELVKNDNQIMRLEAELRYNNPKPFLVFELKELPSNWNEKNL